MTKDIEFKIDAWTPDTLPPARLGLYLVELAKLYGEQEHVRFVKLRKGSAILVSSISEPARPKVERRLFDIRHNLAPKDAIDAFGRIDDMLASDNATAIIRGLEDNKVITFPGRERVKPVEYGLVREEGFIEGEIIRIGGRDQSIHVTLQNGDAVYTAIDTNRDMARNLGPLIFGPDVRLWGTGTWRRGAGLGWHLERFVVSRFEEVGTTLEAAVDRLQSIGGSQWGIEIDPLSVLFEARQEEGPGEP